MKPTILFDIDRTLFDTSTFITDQKNQLLKFLKIPEDKLENVGTKYQQSLTKHTDYDPEKYLKHLINHLDLSKKKGIYQDLYKLYFSSSQFNHHLFPDALPTLANLKSTYTLGIYSEGYAKFQKTKLIKSGLINFFDTNHIFILRRKTDLAALPKLPDHIIIVDDDPTVVDELIHQQIRHITPIWLNRKDSSSHHFARTIHSLTELV